MKTANAMTLNEVYRPRTLAQMVGFGRESATLRAMIQSGRLPSAVAFVGPTGSGKTTAAHALAAELGVDLDWDLTVIKAAECTVAKVREIAVGVRYAGHNGGWRLWIIDEAHTMSGEAKEAWKTVIEDKYLPAKRVFVFCSNNTGNLFRDDAFTDRMQVFQVPAATPDTLRQFVQHVVEVEEVAGAVNVADVVRQAGTSYRRALRLLERAVAERAAGVKPEVQSAECKVQSAEPCPATKSVPVSGRGLCSQCHAEPVHAKGLGVRCYNVWRGAGRPALTAAAGG